MSILNLTKAASAEGPTEILYRAVSRSGGKPRSYAGYVTPAEAQRLARRLLRRARVVATIF